jgi:pimeloyl-ACP methyl ester carboxylesterase
LPTWIGHLELPKADIVGHDLGAPVAYMLAVRHPDRVKRLVVMEAAIHGLRHWNDFVRDTPPWWFAFHNVPALPEA